MFQSTIWKGKEMSQEFKITEKPWHGIAAIQDKGPSAYETLVAFDKWYNNATEAQKRE